ncbi:MAG: hypothetical protein HC880_09790 [Bacteroidia bacterium]|nr:hypothetical protein [Bacteroidia bacterium]
MIFQNIDRFFGQIYKFLPKHLVLAKIYPGQSSRAATLSVSSWHMVKEGVNVQRVSFSTADWGIIRHEISGAILRLSLWAYIVYKNDKGECHYDDVQFTEEYIGNS